MATWFNLWTRRWRNPQGVDVAATTHPPCSYNNNNNNKYVKTLTSERNSESLIKWSEIQTVILDFS